MSDPGYGPPGYGPPGYGLQYPAHGRPTNTLAVAALVFAFVFAPVGLGLGIAARRQIRRTGEEGDGLALAAVIIGSIVTAVFVLIVVVLVVAWFALLKDASFGP
jgi:uncharacterized protein DUF4190